MLSYSADVVRFTGSVAGRNRASHLIASTHSVVFSPRVGEPVSLLQFNT